jgi:1-acyl-sn-glycerol-3-phosphate acyltransferase
MKNIFQIFNSIFIYLRTLIILIILGPFAIIVMILVPKYSHKIASKLSYILFKSFGVKYKIIGTIPDNGPFVIMHNHSSFLDLFFLPIVIKEKYTGIIAAKNFKIPIVGLILKRMKGIPIHRKNKLQSRKSIEIAQERIKEGYHIAIFPEGTRTITGKLSQLKKGGFHMAINAKVKILPVIINGLYDIKPKTRWTINTAVEAKMIIENPIDTINQSVDSLINKVNNLFIKHGLK